MGLRGHGVEPDHNHLDYAAYHVQACATCRKMYPFTPPHSALLSIWLLELTCPPRPLLCTCLVSCAIHGRHHLNDRYRQPHELLFPSAYTANQCLFCFIKKGQCQRVGRNYGYTELHRARNLDIYVLGQMWTWTGTRDKD